VDDLPVVRATESFETFFRREFRAVLGLAVVLSGSVSVAEEITQEAFLATFRAWERVSVFENPEAWVRRIVANRSVSRFRRRVVEARALLRLSPRGVDLDGLAVEVSLDVWQAVRQLPHRQAQVIALTYLLDLPRRGVAEVLDCSEETVKTHLDRARQTLAVLLADTERRRDE
jgi:RNA polymerase sigma-70 factor (ECF subfamily)